MVLDLDESRAGNMGESLWRGDPSPWSPGRLMSTGGEADRLEDDPQGSRAGERWLAGWEGGGVQAAAEASRSVLALAGAGTLAGAGRLMPRKVSICLIWARAATEAWPVTRRWPMISSS